MRTTYVWRGGDFVNKQTGERMETFDGVFCPQIVSDLPSYMSPLGTGLIDGRRARREDLARSNCRPYEPGEWKPSEAFTEREARKAARS